MDESHSDNWQQAPEEQGLSLEELTQAYAQVIGKGEIPYQEVGSEDSESSQSDTIEEYDPVDEEMVETDDCPITPRSILEAILFVGHSDNKPLTADEIANLMRGVRPAEIDQLVIELNQLYSEAGYAFEIVSASGGYQLLLRGELEPVRTRFYGRVRETRLNQQSIDVLALVAYQPGITGPELDDQRGEPTGAILNQLVRRQLLEMRREGKGKQRVQRYYPTDRFLNFMGLSDLSELPQVEDFEGAM